jgi:hypothetical protein
MALASLTLCERERASLAGRLRDVVGNDSVGPMPSDSAPARSGEHGSGIVARRSVAQLDGASPTRPSCA